jgi:hypothetical protein
VLFGFGQAVGHGIVFPRLAKARYSPGFLASIFLHVPIGINYLRAVGSERPLGRGDWARAALYMVAFAALGVGAPQRLLKEESPYRFTERQVGRIAETADASPIHRSARKENSATFAGTEF